MILKGRKIIVGITGGIAVYKVAELVRLLKKEGMEVQVIMTEAATRFVSPLSFEVLSGRAVLSDQFASTGGVSHIELTDWADLMLIAPATANTIGKIATGIADNLLTTMVMACPKPVVVAPAMNHRMFENPIVQANIKRLEELGYVFVGPEEGELACGWSGRGRLVEPSCMVEAVKDVLTPKELSGERLLVTAGPTREPIDPVRFVSNRSSGKMGYELAKEGRRRGAEVVLITGPTHLKPPYGITTVRVSTAEEMYGAVMSYFPQSTILVMAAAVADYRPKTVYTEKVKKKDSSLTLELERTVDILKELGRSKGGKLLVGFALETENLLENAKKKLGEKNLDLIVANSPASMDSDVSTAVLIDRSLNTRTIKECTKEELSSHIFSKIVELKKKRL